jgi:hypothetical protein
MQDATPSIWFSIGAARLVLRHGIHIYTHSRAVFRNILIPDALLYDARVRMPDAIVIYIYCARTHFFKEAAACREKSRSN